MQSITKNADCMAYMKEFPDKFFDLAVVDPPYGDGAALDTHTARELAREAQVPQWNRFGERFDRYKQPPHTHTHATNGRRKGQRPPDWWGLGSEARSGKKIITWDVAPGQDYFEELFRVSRNQIIWGGNYFALPPTRCFLVWRKSQIPLEGFSMAPVEYAWTSFQENAAMFEAFSSGDKTRFHPTQKPVALYAWIFSRWAKAGDKILDTHLGSGSSRIAAWNAGLDFWGVELDPVYFELEEKRFAAHSAQMNLFLP